MGIAFKLWMRLKRLMAIGPAWTLKGSTGLSRPVVTCLIMICSSHVGNGIVGRNSRLSKRVWSSIRHWNWKQNGSAKSEASAQRACKGRGPQYWIGNVDQGSAWFQANMVARRGGWVRVGVADYD